MQWHFPMDSLLKFGLFVTALLTLRGSAHLLRSKAVTLMRGIDYVRPRVEVLRDAVDDRVRR